MSSQIETISEVYCSNNGKHFEVNMYVVECNGLSLERARGLQVLDLLGGVVVESRTRVSDDGN